MSVISVSSEELFSIMQYTNLVRVRFESNDVWEVFPILYASDDQVDVLVDASKTSLADEVGNKAVIKFQRQGYEYIINGQVEQKSLDMPSTLTIKYVETKKYYNLRKYIRFDIDLSSEIRERGTELISKVKCGNCWVECRTRNISKGGAMFIANVKLDFESTIDIKIRFDSSSEITANAKILRVSQLNNGEFGYGIQFIDMDEKDSILLVKEISRLEEKYFKSLNTLREYKKSAGSRFDTKIGIFSYDLDESYDIRESLIKLGTENFDVINNFKFYFDYLTEEKPKLVIIDTNVISDEVLSTVKNIKTDFPDIHVQLVLPVSLQEEDVLKTFDSEGDILFKPLIYNEFEDKIIKYL